MPRVGFFNAKISHPYVIVGATQASPLQLLVGIIYVLQIPMKIYNRCQLYSTGYIV
jgi:hypothetical protein